MRTSLALVTLLAAAPGCVYPSWGGDWENSETSLSTSDPDMNGAVGSVRVGGDRVWIDEAHTYDDGEAFIDIRARGEDGVIMQAITIRNFDRLAIGDAYSVDSIGRYGDDSHPYVSVLGCSGPSDGIWHFDSIADDVEVQVDPGPTADTMRVNVTAHWDGYYDEPSQTVQGSVVVNVH